MKYNDYFHEGTNGVYATCFEQVMGITINSWVVTCRIVDDMSSDLDTSLMQ